MGASSPKVTGLDREKASAENVKQQLLRLERGKTMSQLPPEMRSLLKRARKSGS